MSTWRRQQWTNDQLGNEINSRKNLHDRSRLKPSSLYLFFFLLTMPLIAFVILRFVSVFDDTININKTPLLPCLFSFLYARYFLLKIFLSHGEGIKSICMMRVAQYSFKSMILKVHFLLSFFAPSNTHTHISFYFFFMTLFLQVIFTFEFSSKCLISKKT